VRRLPDVSPLSWDEFQHVTGRAFLTEQLLAADGSVSLLARRLKRNRTDLYKLLYRYRVPIDDIRYALGFDVDAVGRRKMIAGIVRQEFVHWLKSQKLSSLQQMVARDRERTRGTDARRP